MTSRRSDSSDDNRQFARGAAGRHFKGSQSENARPGAAPGRGTQQGLSASTGTQDKVSQGDSPVGVLRPLSATDTSRGAQRTVSYNSTRSSLSGLNAKDAGTAGSTSSAGSGEEELIRVRKRKRGFGFRRHKERVPRKKFFTRKRVLTTLAVLLVLILVGAGATALYIKNSIEQGRQHLLDAQKTELDKSDLGIIEYNGKKYKRNENKISIAVMGFDRHQLNTDDGKAGQADAIMTLVLDTKTGEIDVIAIPRDSMVAVDRYVGGAYIGQVTEQLCLQFSYGDGYQTSAEYTTDAMERVLDGQPISYYFAIDMTGIADINDAAGGVTLTALQSIPNTSIEEGQPITLFGSNAYDYLHYRDTKVLDSAMGRQQRQEQYLKALAEKVLSNVKGGDISSLLNLYKVASQYGVTNIGFDEFSYLASIVAQHGVSSLNTQTFTGTYKQGVQYAEYYLDESSVRQTILDVYYDEVGTASGSDTTGTTTAGSTASASEATSAGAATEGDKSANAASTSGTSSGATS